MCSVKLHVIHVVHIPGEWEQSHLGQNVIVTSHLFSISIASFSPPEVLLASCNLDFKMASKTSLLEQEVFSATIWRDSSVDDNINLQYVLREEYWLESVLNMSSLVRCLHLNCSVTTLFYTKKQTCGSNRLYATVTWTQKSETVTKLKLSH